MESTRYRTIFNHKIQPIPWWHWLYLWMLPTRTYKTTNMVMVYKETRGKMFILDVRRRCSCGGVCAAERN